MTFDALVPRVPRSTGRVRISGVTSSPNVQAPSTGSTIAVTGIDHSVALAQMLAGLEPAVNVQFLPRERLFDLRDPAEGAEMVIIALPSSAAPGGVLDEHSIDWLRQVVATMRAPTFLIIDAPSTHRSVLRSRAQSAGATDTLLERELSPALLEAAIVHARNLTGYEARLGELRERFSLAIRGAKDGMWEWDLVRQRVFYSQRWRELLMLENDPIRPTIDTWLARVHPQDVEKLKAALQSHREGLVPIHESEHRIRDGSGQWRWVLSRSVIHRNAAGAVVRMAGSLTDITPYRMREQAIRHQSRHDATTNLPDRRVFLEHLARAVELACAHDDFEYVVLLVEIDRLTQVRDSFGLGPADELLATIARRLRTCLRPEDHLFRFGPDQLAILLQDIDDPSHGTHIADRIHTAVGEPIELAGQLGFLTVSIGMTSSAHGYSRVDELVADVSAAVTTARDRGRNRYEIYDTSMRIEARTLLALEMSMRQALDSEQFELHYQPIVSLDGREVLGFEALMRWIHPERGMVPPSEFIPIAEDTGLIVALGRWAIREAARQLHAWHVLYGADLTVSVNLSAKQIGDPLLLQTVDAALSEYSFARGALKLELTESVMIEQVDQVTELLAEIRSRGVEVWIDDFGTGFSSLGYLHRFPVDGLKIDRTFVNSLAGTEQSATMVKTILSLAENLGLGVIAEGIETEDQASQLASLGCNMCQGWLFGRPVNSDGVERLLQGG